MKCPVCKFAKCRWVELKDPSKLPTEKIESVVNHNLGYIEMIFSGNQGSAHAEERMHAQLEPYTLELEKRKNETAKTAAQILGAKGGAVKSKAKAKAARENGKWGGRPRKARGSAYGVDR